MTIFLKLSVDEPVVAAFVVDVEPLLVVAVELVILKSNFVFLFYDFEINNFL